MVTISIVIPVYNVSQYIGRCLESVLRQECAEAAIECILVDDCTPDDSMEVVAQCLKDYSGGIAFSVVRHHSNQGLSAARNSGLEAAKGDYVLFLDSDDHLVEGAVSYLVSGLATPAGADGPVADVVMGNSYVCKNEMPAMNFSPDDGPLPFDNADETALRRLLCRQLFHTAWNKLVRRSLLCEHGIRFEPGIIDEDLLWSYLVFLHAQMVLLMPRVTYIYEDNPGSIMNTTVEKAARRVSSRIAICNKILDTPPRQALKEQYMYVFYVLTLAVDQYEQHSQDMAQLKDDLFAVRRRLLSTVRRKRCWLLYLFFLTSKKPYYYISRVRLFRRYYDRIAAHVLALTRPVRP